LDPFNYIELFSGVGGFRMALDELGGHCVFASEIDKYAQQSYKAIYGDSGELHGDITKIAAADIPDHDVLVGGFPCQAFSVAGQRKGFEDTRGTLFFEIARIADAKRPRLLLLENVKGLLSHDGGNTFEVMCRTLNEIGYAIDFRVLNSKYFGVPQNRERIFIVADRDAVHEPWADVKGNDVVTKAKRKANAWGVRSFNFEWPAEGDVTVRLRDVLEPAVDEKYYLSEDKTAKLLAQLNTSEPQVLRPVRTEYGKEIRKQYEAGDIQESRHNMTELRPREDGISNTITTVEKDNLLAVPVVIGSLDHYGNDQMNRVYSVEGVSPTITVVSGGGREQKIAEPQIDKVGHLPSDSGQTGAVYSADGIAPTCLNQHGNAVTKITEPRLEIIGHSGSVGQKGHIYHSNGLASCLTATDYKQPKQIAVREHLKYRIRKLTPLECWRLQGFPDAAHETAKLAGVSDSQRYKQAGNAVTVNVISAIGKRMIARLGESERSEAVVAVG